MNQLRDLIGSECDPDQISGALMGLTYSLRAPVVGGYQITCSDETECECAQSFQQLFAANVLPRLKYDRRSPFRSTNLGARYETGAIAVAEQHFALPEAEGTFKLLVVKVNSHTGVVSGPDGPEYGRICRYGVDSLCCGALAAMLDGDELPAAAELAKTFSSGRRDRLSALRNPRLVPPGERGLRAAIVNARLQAHAVLEDIARRGPCSATVALVLACVSINRPMPDTELVVGEGAVDWNDAETTVRYHGLGDDPAAYRVRYEGNRLHVEDDDWPAP